MHNNNDPMNDEHASNLDFGTNLTSYGRDYFIE